MNNKAIPTLLIATIMIAGAFAFMPVQEASTVHTGATTILGTNGLSVAAVVDNSIDAGALAADAATEIATAVALETLNPFRIASGTTVHGAGTSDTATFTCTATQSCVIYDAVITVVAATATTSVLHVSQVTVAGVALMGAANAVQADNTFGVAATGTTTGTSSDIVTSATAASNVPVSVFGQVALSRGVSGGGSEPITLQSGETMLVTVGNTTTAASTTITFYGAMTGPTDPAAITFE